MKIGLYLPLSDLLYIPSVAVASSSGELMIDSIVGNAQDSFHAFVIEPGSQHDQLGNSYWARLPRSLRGRLLLRMTIHRRGGFASYFVIIYLFRYAAVVPMVLQSVCFGFLVTLGAFIDATSSSSWRSFSWVALNNLVLT